MADPVPGPPGTWQQLARWRDGALDLRATLSALPSDDLSAGLSLCALRPGEFHHDPGGKGTWYIWDGRCHRPDRSSRADRIVIGYAMDLDRVLQACRETVRQQVVLSAGPGAAGTAVQAAFRQAWEPYVPAARYTAALRKSTGASSLLRYLAGMCGVTGSDLADRHPDWLNFANGTLDLRTGTLKPHDPADMITYCLDADFDPQAACPMFWQLLYRACGNDASVAAFLGRVLGYSLLGRNPRQLAVFLSGPTASGKSVLLSIATRALGALGHESQPALICFTKHGRNARTENSIRGARLVTITETSAFMSVDEAQVKRLTGEEWLNIDQHYAVAELETPVTWLIILATNQMPSLVNFDDAMRRRVVVVPMGDTIPAAERDEELARKIIGTERGAILSWLAREAMSYYSGGLTVPPAVQAFTDGYAASQDTVMQFVADTCLMNGKMMWDYNVPAHITMPEAWSRYQEWSRGQPKLGRNEFYGVIAKMPGVSRNDTSRRFEGIMWKPTSPVDFGR